MAPILPDADWLQQYEVWVCAQRMRAFFHPASNDWSESLDPTPVADIEEAMRRIRATGQHVFSGVLKNYA